ncbi:acyltransferase [Sphingobacterium pedocola]|uniref:Acetyltransferase n=1 Tax=Sphingobacterium pedocola TaxID=2082722 RepID=A0ABR9T9N2_9SPHI|nr:acyltransferase [Sphingobacterium pedocola]MBE8722057.1 acetyltransferase [Sphingobacterium pedocola]
MYKLFYKVRRLLYTFICFIQSRDSNVFRCFINGPCKFDKKVIFGNNTSFNGCKKFGSGIVRIGDNFHSAEGLKILTTYHNYNGNLLPYDHTVITKDVLIEDNVWIGMDVMILGGVTIGEGAIIQAGSVVSKSIPKLGIAGGNPARVFKHREGDHYDKLKREKRFL